MKRVLLLSLALLRVLVIQAPQARADVVFSNFGPSNSFDPTQVFAMGWSVVSQGSVANVGESVAARFTVGSLGYSLTSVTLAVRYFQDTNNLALSIVADNGGAPTGPLIETIVSHPIDITNSGQIVSYSSSLSPVLAAGATYWLVAEPIDLNTTNADNNSAYGWYNGAAGGTYAQRYFNFPSGSWDDWQVRPPGLLPAFRIEGFAIPEPSGLSLLLIGSGLIGFRCIPRRFGRQHQT